MKKSRLILFFFISFVFFTQPCCLGYLFGLKSADNTIENIEEIEKKYNIWLPMVGFIFDDRTTNEEYIVKNLKKRLGKNRIYHITLSPDHMTTQEVANGTFDEKYRGFFRTVKEEDLVVIFRTMHEMNGGRYPWGSDPKNFIHARRHVRKLAREEGLNTGNILFSWSVNHRDAPVASGHKPTKQGKLVFCSPKVKEKIGCYTAEDYRPGKKYVDLVGVTFYNRGKASYNRGRVSPKYILTNQNRNTLARLQAFGKPVFVDEVGTTAVRYPEPYDPIKSRKIYLTDYKKKNERLNQLLSFLQETPSIVGVVYFNSDFTNGLQKFSDGEADWAVINLENDKIYYGIYNLILANPAIHQSKLLSLFSRTSIKTHKGLMFVYKEDKNRLIFAKNYIIKNYSTFSDIIKILSDLENATSGNYKNTRRIGYLKEILKEDIQTLQGNTKK